MTQLKDFKNFKWFNMAQYIKNTIAENFTGTHGLAKPEEQFSLNDVPDLSGKVGVVTGGSEGYVKRGIGQHVLQPLVKRGPTNIYPQNWVRMHTHFTV